MTIRLRLIMCVMVVVCCVSCTPGPADPEILSTTQVDDTPAIDRASDPSETSADGPPVGGDKPLQEVAGGDSLIGWDALDIGMQADVVYRPFFLQNNPRTEALDGKRVRIGGFMHGGVSQPSNLTEFILLKNNRCKYGPGGQADHLIRVFVKNGVRVDFTTEMIYVEGVLTLQPEQGPDGNTWSIYDLKGDAFSSRKRL
ncbi:MAG: hypothetical protein VX346_26985 [Planctomycetota bacterium]|nr:hypothetical protein [Planctomycetota bacterium]